MRKHEPSIRFGIERGRFQHGFGTVQWVLECVLRKCWAKIQAYQKLQNFSCLVFKSLGSIRAKKFEYRSFSSSKPSVVSARIELIKNRCNFYGIHTNEDQYICGNHRYDLGIGWKARKLCLVKTCKDPTIRVREKGKDAYEKAKLKDPNFPIDGKMCLQCSKKMYEDSTSAIELREINQAIDNLDEVPAASNSTDYSRDNTMASLYKSQYQEVPGEEALPLSEFDPYGVNPITEQLENSFNTDGEKTPNKTKELKSTTKATVSSSDEEPTPIKTIGSILTSNDSNGSVFDVPKIQAIPSAEKDWKHERLNKLVALMNEYKENLQLPCRIFRPLENVTEINTYKRTYDQMREICSSWFAEELAPGQKNELKDTFCLKDKKENIDIDLYFDHYNEAATHEGRVIAIGMIPMFVPEKTITERFNIGRKEVRIARGKFKEYGTDIKAEKYNRNKLDLILSQNI